jgi:hypothetical protein
VKRLLAGAALVVLAAIIAFGWTSRPLQPSNPRTGEDDIRLYSAMIADLRAGVPYYTAVGSELRSRGYPTVPVMNWRTPLHLTLVASLPPPLARALVVLMAVAIVVGTIWAYAPHGPEMVAAATLLAFGAAAPLALARPAVLFAEAWSGACIAISLICYMRERWIAGAVFGIVAVFLRELAVPYVLLCGIIALWQRRRAESLAWILGGIGYVAYYGVHAHLAASHIRPGDLAHQHSWVSWHGLPFVFATAQWYGWSLLAPKYLPPIVVAAALAGTAARGMPAQLRAALLAYVVVFCVIGQSFDSYWGLVTTPLWAFGLTHALEGLTTLGGLAFPRAHPI